MDQLQARQPSPISEEADDGNNNSSNNNNNNNNNDDNDNDDDTSSAYGRTIRRIVQRTRAGAPMPELRLNMPATNEQQLAGPMLFRVPTTANANTVGDNNEIRSLYSINEYETSTANEAHLQLHYQASQPMQLHLHHQLETSFATSAYNDLECSQATTTDQPFEFIIPNADELANQPPPFARRYFYSQYNSNNNSNFGSQQYLNHHHHHHQQDIIDNSNNNNNSGGSADYPAGGESSEPDLNTKWSWKNLKREFKLSHSESLFHLYQAKLQHSFFVASLILNIIFNLGAVISYCISKYHEMNIYLIIMRLAAIVVFISFLVLIWFNKIWMQSKFSRTVASLAVLMAMIFGEASGAICALVNDQTTPLASIRRTYYLIITNHVFLPFPTRIQACAATIVITSFEIVVTYISRRDNNCRADYLTLYSIADIIFYASSAMIGFQITFLLEIAIRRTFLNHKYCIQSTYKLNYEKEQQEQLLRSCFPQHLIERIRDEIRDSIARISKRQSQPFKPFYNLYVEKYENVTILYADIVNSMNLTDKLNPAELVETLNELYGRFDELAEKYSCLRIKLLGDCYYCVSGLPEFDDDHALKCLLMGLGMIKIIKSIRQSRNDVDIDMRIGIHSGSVLSGLLGLRKWQFDIWSFDAMKASRMEHSGQPGFVHITQETLDLIPKEHPRMRDLIITETRKSGSEPTYLISERVAVGGGGGGGGQSSQQSGPWSQPDQGQQLYGASNSASNSPSCGGRRIGQSEKLKAYIEKLRVRPTANAMDFTQRRMALESSLKKYREIHEKVDETMKTAIAEMPLGSAWKQFFFIDCLALGGSLFGCRQDLERPDQEDEEAAAGAGAGKLTGATNGKPQRERALSRMNSSNNNNNNSSKCKLDTTTSKPSKQLGHKIQLTAATSSGGSNGGPRKRRGAGVKGRRQAKQTPVRSPSNKAILQTDPLFHLYLICVGLITLSILAIKCLIPGMPIYSHTVIGFAFLLVIILASTIYTQVKSKKISLPFRILLWLIISASLTMLQLVDLIVPDELDSLNLQSIADITRADSLSCAFAWYYTFTIIVAMTATSIFIRINVWLKFMIHTATIVFYIVINNPPATMMETLKEFLQTQSNNSWSLLDHKQELSHLFYISMIAVILHLIDRQVEYILSLNIQWNEQLESDRIESQTVGEINRILLENILPPHVLKRYLYNTTVSYDQLYHESHPSCAVMFASIPNYESFYTENNLNEQGLKCLQLLNEIICDFDQLLSHPAFRTIEKIKTIGSTYMAACFDVTRRTSDCQLTDAPETLAPTNSACYTPELGLKTGWINGAMAPGGQQADSACSSPRLGPSSAGQQQQQQPFEPLPNNINIINNNNNTTTNGAQSLKRRGPRGSLQHLDEIAISNVVTMVCFGTALMENLARINRDAWQEFRLRIGIAIGPVIAGVVGASKPTYDIWGDTVNVASRLESSGVLGRIQVSEQVAQILARHGQFDVECRGPIEVKGKGRLTTYLVITPYDSLDERQQLDDVEEDFELDAENLDYDAEAEADDDAVGDVDSPQEEARDSTETDGADLGPCKEASYLGLDPENQETIDPSEQQWATNDDDDDDDDGNIVEPNEEERRTETSKGDQNRRPSD